jgi:hypothetical protein
MLPAICHMLYYESAQYLNYNARTAAVRHCGSMALSYHALLDHASSMMLFWLVCTQQSARWTPEYDHHVVTTTGKHAAKMGVLVIKAKLDQETARRDLRSPGTPSGLSMQASRPA